MARPSDIIADARHWNFIDRFAPAAAKPYFKLARLDRPIGTWLLLWPGLWSVALAAAPGQWPDITLIVLFCLGSLVMRGAGCTFNDIVDRDFDGRVERTRARPIPSGQVSLVQAIIWMTALALIGLIILLQMNPVAVAVGAASLVLIVIYPFMKRVTYWPQAWLGLTFNWGALLGWAAVTGTIAGPALWLYGAGIFWTLGYDTIYAHQDKEDDALIGVKSTALKLGDQTRPWLFGFFGLALAGYVMAGYAAGIGSAFYIGAALGAGQLFWQAARIQLDDSEDCSAKFKSNSLFGWILFAAIIAGKFW